MRPRLPTTKSTRPSPLKSPAVPPPLALLEARHRHSLESSTAIVMKHGDRHPLADNHEIESSIAVDILPGRIGHHADVLQLGCELRRHVGEVASAVVMQ